MVVKGFTFSKPGFWIQIKKQVLLTKNFIQPPESSKNVYLGAYFNICVSYIYLFLSHKL